MNRAKTSLSLSPAKMVGLAEIIEGRIYHQDLYQTQIRRERKMSTLDGHWKGKEESRSVSQSVCLLKLAVTTSLHIESPLGSKKGWRVSQESGLTVS